MHPRCGAKGAGTRPFDFAQDEPVPPRLPKERVDVRGERRLTSHKTILRTSVRVNMRQPHPRPHFLLHSGYAHQGAMFLRVKVFPTTPLMSKASAVPNLYQHAFYQVIVRQLAGKTVTHVSDLSQNRLCLTQWLRKSGMDVTTTLDVIKKSFSCSSNL
jgi:hypothetical protein